MRVHCERNFTGEEKRNIFWKAKNLITVILFNAKNRIFFFYNRNNDSINKHFCLSLFIWSVVCSFIPKLFKGWFSIKNLLRFGESHSLLYIGQCLLLKKNVSLCKLVMNFSRHTHKTSKLNWIWGTLFWIFTFSILLVRMLCVNGEWAKSLKLRNY